MFGARRNHDNAIAMTLILFAIAWAVAGPSIAAKERRDRNGQGPLAALSQILGRPTDRSVALNVLSATGGEAFVKWGAKSGEYVRRSATVSLRAGVPTEIELDGLSPDTRHFYRLCVKGNSDQVFNDGDECSFQTQRAPGSAFTFALHGDSHPERSGKMFDGGLYARALRNVAADRPDFFLTLGDDFSIERLIDRDELSQDAVDRVYAGQRGFLGIVGASSPLFLVNGNHEQAARYLLDGTDGNAAILAARARTKFYPLPAPDGFYTGDAEEVEGAGLLRDYYAWEWGDALFVVIDPYWHSPDAVDNKAGERKGGKGKRDLWQATLGEAQYRWLEKTLTGSRARWKFVFAHHVNGTGRGGVEEADLYEWGGKDRRGRDEFAQKRPGWALPIHALMAKAGVTVLFQGHDHVYARQEKDGVVYQSAPNPADPTYQTFNREAYRSGDVMPNSGHIRVTVSPEDVRVDYVRAALPGNEAAAGGGNGSVADSYAIRKGR